MTALLILNDDVTDAAGLAAYRELASPLLAAAGTRVVITAETEDLGEAGPAGTHTVDAAPQRWRPQSAAG